MEPRVSPGHLDKGTLGTFVLFMQNIGLSDFGIGCSELGSAALPILLPDHSNTEHNLSSLGSQVCLCQPTSTARLCSLSLYLVSFLLSFVSDNVAGADWR